MPSCFAFGWHASLHREIADALGRIVALHVVVRDVGKMPAMRSMVWGRGWLCRVIITAWCRPTAGVPSVCSTVCVMLVCLFTRSFVNFTRNSGWGALEFSVHRLVSDVRFRRLCSFVYVRVSIMTLVSEDRRFLLPSKKTTV